MNRSKRKDAMLKGIPLKIVLGSVFPLLILMQKALQACVYIINNRHSKRKKREVGLLG